MTLEIDCPIAVERVSHQYQLVTVARKVHERIMDWLHAVECKILSQDMTVKEKHVKCRCRVEEIALYVLAGAT